MSMVREGTVSGMWEVELSSQSIWEWERERESCLLTTRSIDGIPELSKLPLGEVVLLPGSLLPLSESVSSRALLERAVCDLRLDSNSTWFVDALYYGLLWPHLILRQSHSQLIVPPLLFLSSKPMTTHKMSLWALPNNCQDIVALCVSIEMCQCACANMCWSMLVGVNTCQEMLPSKHAHSLLLIGSLFLLSKFFLQQRNE